MKAAAAPFVAPVPPHVWACAAASFAAYALLYRLSSELSKRHVRAYQRLGADKRVDWNTRLPSTVHAVVVSAICIQQLISGAFSDAACAADGVPAMLRTTPGSWAAVGISLGYFVADAFMVLAHEAIYGNMIFVHHVMALVSLFTAIESRGAHAYVLFGLFTEVTTPMVNLRWRLAEAGASGGKLYLANGLAMTAAWGVCRVALFGPLFAHVKSHFRQSIEFLPPYAVGVLLGVPALLFLLNLAWFAKMVQGAAKMVRTRRSGDGAADGAHAAAAAEAAAKSPQGKARRGAGGAAVVVEAFAPPGGVGKDE